MIGQPGTTIDLEGFSVINPRTYHTVIWERRFMATATIATGLCIILFSVAVGTTHWAYATFAAPNGETVQLLLGIWGEFRDSSNITHSKSQWLSHFPNPPLFSIRLDDNELPQFYRAQAVFSIISLVFMLAGNLLAYYTFRHHRYIYKRLTACIDMFTALCVIVVIEVISLSFDNWKIHVPRELNPMDIIMKVLDLATEDQDYIEITKLDIRSGYSIYVSWFIVGTYIASAIVFAVSSRKRKGSRAATSEFEIEDRPVNIGR